MLLHACNSKINECPSATIKNRHNIIRSRHIGTPGHYRDFYIRDSAALRQRLNARPPPVRLTSPGIPFQVWIGRTYLPLPLSLSFLACTGACSGQSPRTHGGPTLVGHEEHIGYVSPVFYQGLTSGLLPHKCVRMVYNPPPSMDKNAVSLFNDSLKRFLTSWADGVPQDAWWYALDSFAFCLLRALQSFWVPSRLMKLWRRKHVGGAQAGKHFVKMTLKTVLFWTQWGRARVKNSKKTQQHCGERAAARARGEYSIAVPETRNTCIECFVFCRISYWQSLCSK